MLPVDVESLRLFLHVLAAAVWVGGQITLGALVPVLRRAGADAPRAAAQAFGRLAWTAFSVLVATGVWNIAAYHDRERNGGAATMTVKVILVGLSGIATLVHVRATSRAWLAIGGAGGLLFSLGALLLGVELAQ